MAAVSHGGRVTTLYQLIEQAKAATGDGLCSAVGHDWQSIGGRACPRAPHDALGSEGLSGLIFAYKDATGMEVSA